VSKRKKKDGARLYVLQFPRFHLNSFTLARLFTPEHKQPRYFRLTTNRSAAQHVLAPFTYSVHVGVRIGGRTVDHAGSIIGVGIVEVLDLVSAPDRVENQTETFAREIVVSPDVINLQSIFLDESCLELFSGHGLVPCMVLGKLLRECVPAQLTNLVVGRQMNIAAALWTLFDLTRAYPTHRVATLADDPCVKQRFQANWALQTTLYFVLGLHR